MLPLCDQRQHLRGRYARVAERWIGTAYVFRGAGSSRRQVAALQATGRTGSDLYGAGVGISGSIAVVGAFATCKVYVFQI
jgi:hypothetical protein